MACIKLSDSMFAWSAKTALLWLQNSTSCSSMVCPSTSVPGSMLRICSRNIAFVFKTRAAQKLSGKRPCISTSIAW